MVSNWIDRQRQTDGRTEREKKTTVNKDRNRYGKEIFTELKELRIGQETNNLLGPELPRANEKRNVG